MQKLQTYTIQGVVMNCNENSKEHEILTDSGETINVELKNNYQEGIEIKIVVEQKGDEITKVLSSQPIIETNIDETFKPTEEDETNPQNSNSLYSLDKRIQNIVSDVKKLSKVNTKDFIESYNLQDKDIKQVIAFFPKDEGDYTTLIAIETNTPDEFDDVLSEIETCTKETYNNDENIKVYKKKTSSLSILVIGNARLIDDVQTLVR